MRHVVYFGHALALCGGRIRRALFCSALVAFTVLAVSGCGKHEATSSTTEKRPVDVSMVTVKSRDVPVSFKYIAQVQSSREVNIQARVSGFLEQRVYTEGSIVKEGQTLFLMDQKPFKAQLDQAEAALARQEAAYEVASRNLARVKPLAAANALSKKDLEDATGQYESTAAAVNQAKAAVEQAQLNLSYTVIKSPVAGVTSSALQAEGTYLSPTNSQLTTVSVLSPIYINFSISENDLLRYRDQVAKGQLIEPKNKNFTVEVVLSNGSIYPYKGQVTFAAPSFDSQTGTFLIRATVENPDSLLRPNQYVHVLLEGTIRPHAILLPQRAVQQSSKGHFVWVVGQGDKVEPRPITVGSWYKNDWFIDEGLQAGDQVVVDGALTLHPGSVVKTHPLADESEAAEAKATAGDSPNSRQ